MTGGTSMAAADTPIPDPVGAFCAHGWYNMRPVGAGPLAGWTFGVKDLFDVAGLPTGAGSPEWLRTHPRPSRTAPAVQRLLDAGATLLGKTQTDELAWSLNGQNAHYGTPINAAAPERIPGGSSSGSAAAVAAGLVDFAVGSDTGGSVRLPASYCGIYGMRPSHGRIPIEGAVPLAPSFDTVGWFAREASRLAAVGRILLADPAPAAAPARLLIATDLVARLAPPVRAALEPALAGLQRLLGTAQPVILAGDALPAWREAFRLIQSAEVWSVHGAWVTETAPALGPGIRDRFLAASRLAPAEVAAARRLRLEVRQRLDDLLVPGTVLAVPGAPEIAPLRSAPPEELERVRAEALALLCPAGHAGLPQISLPLARLDGCPLALSVMSARGSDTTLLALASALAAAPA
ncbi:MAG: amidase [Alphaproteobacteria bacterium]|nr:amidase [Alphaproteobacteria bacterium]